MEIRFFGLLVCGALRSGTGFCSARHVSIFIDLVENLTACFISPTEHILTGDRVQDGSEIINTIARYESPFVTNRPTIIMEGSALANKCYVRQDC